MTGGLTIRNAESADLPAVLNLWGSAGAVPSATDDLEGLERLLRNDHESLLLAQVQGEIVGTLIAGWDGWRGSFYRLAIEPGRRRDGIATALVRAGEEKLLRQGARRLTAIVAADEEGAMSLWRAVGYTQQTDRVRFVRTIEL
ncbi:MAG TPA: GNAT family N-acetyltransferase [Solirubrobacterales bacterium]